MSKVTAADVSKLRKSTGAGMMDCKNALVEAEGDFDKAVEIIRKKGQAVANKRADREATEGCVVAKTASDNKRGVVVALNCETDFVAKNDDFVAFANQLADLAIANKPASKDELLSITVDGRSVSDIITEKIGSIGEKIELSFYENIDSEYVIPYIHLGSKLGTIVGFNKEIADEQVAKDVAMQVAAMNPVAIDKGDVPQDVINKEIEIGKEQAKQEGKPENLLEKIAMGKLNKFYKENTLLNQAFIKDQKISVTDYLKGVDKDLTVTKFYRIGLAE
ncbi:MAG: elongation factor Ts [Marinilabiliales bacterium]|nr:MAG: elongation factor Ts [Marinilabiliales bacterium]